MLGIKDLKDTLAWKGGAWEEILKIEICELVIWKVNRIKIKNEQSFFEIHLW